ncbi:MAG: DUF1302 family protein [Myxococcota bacterium]
MHFARAATLLGLIAAFVVGGSPDASAIEFAEGRVQIHGFGEVQMRALDEKFQEELDLAMWYNILNVELEFDIAPDGFGPFDLISAYVRAEARYDAIYSEGFTLFPSVNTFGNDAERLPTRLSDAVDKDYAGVVPSFDRDGNFGSRRIDDKAPANLVPVGERKGFPGNDTFFRQRGPDNQAGPNMFDNRGTVTLPRAYDDPAWYVHEAVLDYEFALKEIRGTANTGTQILGPWLPRNYIRSMALIQDRGNPFRGRVAPTKARIGSFGPGFTVRFRDDAQAIRHFQGDPALVVAPGTTRIVDRLDPMLEQLLNAPASVRVGLVPIDYETNGGFVDSGIPLTAFFPSDFGGDFLGGIAACTDPTAGDSELIRRGQSAPPSGRDCIRGSVDIATADPMTGYQGDIYTDPNILGITMVTGGGGENPFRPAPDVSNLGRVIIDDMGNELGNPDDPDGLLTAQGIYIPSVGARQVVNSGRLDSLNFNFDENDREWNRGDAQQRNKELKEAYADIELLDSRLWLRLGLQNIVWGKTELFRTTDQFNPQDLALASLPSLEESRVALWSARAVYSLYDVGPLEDVRLEFATNIDEFQPADIGACGEPFTPDLVCSLTTGIYAHGLLGIGVVGIDRPENPWKELSDLEFGGRIEWRWDRFSFALTDFYGFSDFPYVDTVFFYERAVDPESGRPLVARLPGQNLGTCSSINAGVASNFLAGGAIVPEYSTSFANHPISVTTGARFPLLGIEDRGGIGYDPGCLRPGGPPGSPNAMNTFADPVLRNDDGNLVPVDDDIANTNALEWHSANQQIFSWICAGTVGIAAVLDASACAWTIFSTPEVLLPQLLQVPFVELITITAAGSQAGIGAANVLSTVGGNQKYNEADFTAPFASINALYNDPSAPIFDRNDDGGLGNGPNDASDCASPDPAVRYDCDLRGFDGFDGRVGLSIFGLRPSGEQVAFQTLDNSLTNEQRALLGCGPFYGTRCDSSANVNPLPVFPGDTNRDPRVYARAGGLDFLNMEASALMQAWPGFEGTQIRDHLTTASLSDYMQPGTVADGQSFFGGPVCTRFTGIPGQTVKLPGCRGIQSLDVVHTVDDDPSSVPLKVTVEFEDGYLPSVDGCVIGDRVMYAPAANGVVPVDARYASGADATTLLAELALCNRARREEAIPRFNLNGYNAAGEPILTANPAAMGTCQGAFFGRNNPGTPPLGSTGTVQGQIDFTVCRSAIVELETLPLIHPTAGCIDSDVWFDARADNVSNDALALPFGGCEYFYERDFVTEFFEGTAALFQNELAAVSWNFMLFLATSSCNEASLDLDNRDHRQPPAGQGFPIGAVGGIRADPTCFDAERPWTPGRCSFASPQFCGNVSGFLGAAGVRRPVARAGGNTVYGRRTFVWHGGGEAVLTYEQRNVFGFSTDFAEDVTKTNWGVEFTWIEDVPYTDNDSWTGITRSDAYNLTVSVDRPTFINFLNPNRTFFFNSQWFFNYRPDYNNGFTSNGPFNVLFTFAMFTGYFQDRVMPQLVTVYDFGSQSGGILPNLQYRFTESFSVTVGMLYFFGSTKMTDMPVNELGPPANRAGEYSYESPVENGLSLIRKRDEVFMRLRWTF